MKGWIGWPWMYERICQNTWYKLTLISLRGKMWLLTVGSFLGSLTKKKKKEKTNRRARGLKLFEKLKKVHCYQTKPRVKHWTVMVWQCSIWQRSCGYFSPSPPLPLHVPCLSLPLPSFPPTLESIWKINCVTLNVICCSLQPDFLCLTPCPCLCFFTFPPLYSFCLHLVSITAPLVCLWFVSGEIYAQLKVLHCFGELHEGYCIPPPPIS